jgi:RND superfamily putative drug exporter
VLASITLLPALFSLLGPRINRIRVMPKRFVAPPDPDHGFWGSWARLVTRRPLPVFFAGLAIVAIVVAPAFHMNPSDAQLKDEPAAGDAAAGAAAISAAGLPAGVFLPYIALVENGATPQALAATAQAMGDADGISGAAAPTAWRKGGTGLVEAFGVDDANSRQAVKTMSSLKHHVLPAVRDRIGGNVAVTLGGVGPESRDFISAVYGKFPYVLLFVLILTFVLLMRAFRSIVLPLKAVILNLVSLGAAYGIVVFIFQDGHGSDAIWGIQATDAVISWIPLMIFAFLYGISMDYEVFMITRMREAYDETGDTPKAIELGLARTGKLVTSAALVLMFAFFSLSTSPGPDIKQFAIGLSAGIIFDATVIRALLVPSTMQLLGRWNWWLPHWTARLLRTRPSPLQPARGEA